MTLAIPIPLCTCNTYPFLLPSLGSAGTTECFRLARQYLEGFQTPLDIISGNHDLEGLDEFPSDQENLAAFQVIILCLFRKGVVIFCPLFMFLVGEDACYQTFPLIPAHKLKYCLGVVGRCF